MVLKSENGLKKFRETRYPHNRSEGTALRRSNGATKQLIKEKTLITLAKGDEPADLTGVQKLVIGAKWDTSGGTSGIKLFRKFKAAIGADIDLFGIARQRGKAVRYAGLDSLDPMSGSMIHTGDETSGHASGDDEQVIVDFTNMPAPVDSIVFVAAAFKPGNDFAQASNIAFKVYDASGGTTAQVAEIWPQLVSRQNACAIAKAVKGANGWTFEVLEAFGNVRHGDMESLMRFAEGK